MDMLYARYSSPLDLMNMYINRGRFGKFVDGFLKAEYERRKEENNKNNEWMMWVAYIHSYSDKSFNDWKKQFTSGKGTTAKANSDANLDDEGIQRIMNKMFQG